MRIGIDARELCGQPTGVGRYLQGLLTEWGCEQRGHCHEFVLYAHGTLALHLDSRRFVTRLVPGGGGSYWEQIQLPIAASRDHLDVFFSPGYTAPVLLKTPLVVAIHDVSFAAHPEWFSTREGLRRRLLSRRAARTARTVITISEFSRREILEHLGTAPSKIRVIPPGISSPSAIEGNPSTVAGHRTAVNGRVLYVGSVFDRRHIPDLVRAFASVARRYPAVTLDLIGDNRTFPRRDIGRTIANERLDGRIRWRQYVSDDELSLLYRQSRAFAFLSEYEGLGLTPLEALAAGVPSVLLDTPVARESCGTAALYVGRGDLPAIAAALERLLFDERTRESLLAAAPAVLARYQWPTAAHQTLAVLEKAA